MEPFINKDFLLSTDAAKELYHEHAEKLPIIDYHCHLSPEQIANNIQFRDITQLWLVDGHAGDHYKWRAMRGNGVTEDYITGGTRSSWETFLKWAETVPYTMRNPLYHWTHLELSRVFGIEEPLNADNARQVYDRCNELLATEEFRGQALIRKFNVETVCTTDDPADSLEFHKQIAQNPFGTKVLPTFRPDKAMAIEIPDTYRDYIIKLAATAQMDIVRYADLVEALRKRHDYFDSLGCRLSDHGIDTFYSCDYTDKEIERIFCKVLCGNRASADEIAKFRSAVLHDCAVMDAQSGWVQQFHVGPLRNNNTLMYNLAGPDTGYDAIGDKSIAEAGHRFFDRLTLEGALAKTILYCLNPKDYEVMATMAYTFNDGSCPGMMQLGSGWWFLDHEKGIREQLDTISSLGLLSRFVGMLTDSRSFISYPRHEYFRRILCDVIGSDVESGRLPASEMQRISRMVEDISYYNAKEYFKF